jgi:hypothetical protein
MQPKMRIIKRDIEGRVKDSITTKKIAEQGKKYTEPEMM